MILCVDCFVLVSVTVPFFICFCLILVQVAEWSPFGKYLSIVCLFVNLVDFPFDYKNRRECGCDYTRSCSLLTFY